MSIPVSSGARYLSVGLFKDFSEQLRILRRLRNECMNYLYLYYICLDHVSQHKSFDKFRQFSAYFDRIGQMSTIVCELMLKNLPHKKRHICFCSEAYVPPGFYFKMDRSDIFSFTLTYNGIAACQKGQGSQKHHRRNRRIICGSCVGCSGRTCRCCSRSVDRSARCCCQ